MKPPEELPETYNSGIRFSSDGADCSVPLAIDSRNFCTFKCVYCFGQNLMRNPDRNPALRQKKQLSIKRLEKFLNRELKDPVSLAAYPLLDAGVPVQLGALGDSFDETELVTTWAKQAIPLFRKYRVPVRIGTKGGRVLQLPEYLRLFENDSDMFWFAFSIICNDDDLVSKIDIRAPVTSERLRAMSLLTKLGCKASLRFRPFLPGVSDTFPGGPPNAWEVLIDRCHEAGARAISYEWLFLNRNNTPRQESLNQHLFEKMGNPNFGEYWKKNSPKESAMRGKKLDKYEMTMRIKEKVLGLGWTFGISDPHYREENTTFSCCAFPDDDPWFGKYNRDQLTRVLVEGRRAYDEGRPWSVTFSDWVPDWAKKIKKRMCVSLGDAHTHKKYQYQTIADDWRNKWNNPNKARGPEIYFRESLVPTGTDEATGDLIYEYQPWV